MGIELDSFNSWIHIHIAIITASLKENVSEKSESNWT